MIAFLLTISLHLGPQNLSHLSDYAGQAPLVLCLSHACSPFSIQVRAAWTQLQRTFENSSAVVLADAHCSEREGACPRSSRAYPQFLRYGGPLAPASIRVSPGISYAALLHFTESLLSVVQHFSCQKVPDTLSTFPAFVFGGPLSSVCQKIRDITEYVPDQVSKMYYTVGTDARLVVWFSQNKSIVHKTGSEIEFIQYYSHPILDDLNFGNLLSFLGPKAFLITNNPDDCDHFRRFFQEFEGSALIGKAGLIQFNERFTQSQLNTDQLPAIVLERSPLPLVQFTNVRADDETQLDNVRAALNERESVRPPRRFGWKKSAPLEFRKDRFIFTSGLAIATIIAAVAIILHTASACIHHTDRNPSPVFLV
jgi:hypothetical protein